MSEREYVGIELHRCRSVIVRVDGEGKHLSTARVANDPHCRIRQDRVHSGKVTLRYRGRLYQLAVGRQHESRRAFLS